MSDVKIFGRKKQPATSANLKAADSEAWVASTVTPSDSATSRFERNITSYELMQRASGLAAILAGLNAQACADQTLRLFRVRTPSRGRGGDAPRAAKIRQGRMGTKAAERASRGDVVELTKHPALQMVRDPLRGTQAVSGYQWLWQKFWYLEIVGDAYDLVAETDDGIALLPLAPQWTLPIPGKGRVIDGYAYGRDRSEIREFSQDDVHHYRFVQHPDDPFRGLGSLEPAIRAADVLLSEDEFQKDRIRNGNVPPTLYALAPDGQASRKQLEQFKAEYESRLRGGFRQRFKALFTDLPLTATPLPQTPEQMQAQEELGRQRMQLLNSFGVPESMVELNSANLASSRSGYEVQFLDATVRPRINVVADQLTSFIMPLFGLDPEEYFFAFDDPVPQNLQAESAVMVSLVGSGILTPNEAREELGYERVNDDGADELGGAGEPAGVFGGGGFGGQPPRRPSETLESQRSETEPGEDISVRVHRVEPGNDDGSSGNEAVRKAIEDADIFASSCPQCGIDHGEKAVDPVFQSVDDIGDILSLLRGRIQSFLSADLAAKLSALNTARSTIPTADIDALIRELEEPVGRLFAEGMVAGAQEVGADIPLPDDVFELVNENARAALDQELLSLATDLDQTTRDMITSAVDRGIEGGLGIDDIKSEIQESGIDSDARAEMIARTETQQAANAGKVTQFGELGFKRKIWENAPGATAVHQELTRMFSDGVPMGDPFLTPGQTVVGRDGSSETFRRAVFFPPARPNCRCSVRAVQDEDDQ